MSADVAAGRRIPSPEPIPETLAFWDAAAAGELLLKHCESCGQAHHYPRSLCPFCLSERTTWRRASGEGVIYSFSLMPRVAVPYVLAYVTLDEGPTMMTNIVAADFGTLHIGQRVRVVFVPSVEGRQVPMFTPA
jgi:uncharacterized protein